MQIANFALADDDSRTRWERLTLAGARPESSAGSVAFPRLLRCDADRLAAALAEREGVLILPGSQFGYAGNHFRIEFGRTDMPPALQATEQVPRPRGGNVRIPRL